MSGFYIHFPYCLKKCPYCDFNSHIRKQYDQQAYTKAIIQEITAYAQKWPNLTISSIFFGGGTPSLWHSDYIQEILDTLYQHFERETDTIEITLEANPATIERGIMANFSAAGINRVSLGVQSLYDDDLQKLGRLHNGQDALSAMEDIKKHIPNWSFDLIYARPWQSIDAWRDELGQALLLGAKHISLYHLTIEEGTDFHRQHRLGKLKEHDEETQRHFLQLTRDIIAQSPYDFYEISNACLPHYQCQHNLCYWQYKGWVGLGAGAHGRINNGGQVIATQNYRLPEKYMAMMQQQNSAIEVESIIDSQTLREETIMMGLRCNNGIDAHLCATDKIQDLCEEKYIYQDKNRLFLTENGLYLTNKIVEYLL